MEDVMLFGDVTDCEECPFNKGEEGSDYCDHSGSPDGNLPCLHSDIYGDLTFEEVVDVFAQRSIDRQNYLDKIHDIEQKKLKKKEEAQKKRKQSNLLVFMENKLIRKIKKQIGTKKCAIALASSLSIFFDKPDPPQCKILEEEIKTLWDEIDKLETIKKEKLKLNKRK
jgi:hypothetical protein